MKLSFHLKSLSHHAYLLIDGDSLKDELISSLDKDHGITIQSNPDFFDRKYQNFTIDDARELKSAHEMRPILTEGKKIFIISMNGVTVEAQNAMLKLLEEPAEYAHFFLIVPSAHLLLPTVKSRLSLIDTEGFNSSGALNSNDDSKLTDPAKSADSPRVVGKEAKNTVARNMPPDDLSKVTKIFVTSNIPERLEFVKKLVEDISKEKKIKQDAIDFLDALQAYLYEKNGPKDGKVSLEVIETARMYVNDRSPSLKMLLEYVALSI